MTRTAVLKSPVWIFAIPLCLLATLCFIALSPAIMSKDPGTMYMALTLDFTLTLPLVYFFLIRKRSISKFTIVPIFIAGIILSTLLIPTENKATLEIIKTWVFPLVELFVIGTIIYKTYNFVKAYKAAKNSSPDFFEVIQSVTRELMPKKVGPIFSYEISFMYYAFAVWRPRPLNRNEFSYHNRTSILPLLYGFCLVIIAEGIGIHMWLQKHSVLTAWILTFLSAYGFLQVLAICKAVVHRPIVLKEEFLHVKFGLMGDIQIPYNQIGSMEVWTKDLPENDKSLKKLSLVDHNILITFKENLPLKGLYGITKDYGKLAFFVDDHQRFIDEVNQKRS